MSETPHEIIHAIRSDVEQAAEAILSAAELGLGEIGRARGGEADAFDKLEMVLCAVLEACAFQDLTGQRLSKLEAAIGPGGAAISSDPLLNGPALAGRGLDQSAADSLLNGAASMPASVHAAE